MGRKQSKLDIVMTGYAGLAESKKLAREHRDLLRQTLSFAFLQQLEDLPEDVGMAEHEDYPAVPVDRGGVLEALWNLAELAETGLNVDMEKIPVRQETIEVCEVLDVNPYQLPSGGFLYLTVNGNGDPGRVIGQTNSTKARTVTGREGTRYLDKPRHRA